MRIIAGTHRGRPLLGPKDAKTTRPITDRVKEALFNRLHSLGVLGYGHAVEVFCGTGSLGLEALSRGAEHCTFVDRDRDAVSRLKQNLEALGLADRATVHHGGALPPMWAMRLKADSVSVAFLDPPFKQARRGDRDRDDDEAPHVNAGPDEQEPANPAPHLHAGLTRELPGDLLAVFTALLPKLEPGGVLLLRTGADVPELDEVDGYDGPASFVYGAMTLHFFQRPMENDEAAR